MLVVSKLRCLRLRGGGGVHVLSEERLMGFVCLFGEGTHARSVGAIW